MGTDSTKISSYNSIYDFLILKGLLTTPAKNNPYILLYEHLSSDDDERNRTEASKSLMNSKRKDLRIHDLEELLDHFSLHIIKIEDQSTSFQCLANYIIERITNINLVNHIYDSFKKFEKPKENLKIWYYLMNLFGALGIYPLVKFRLRLIEWYINNCKETDNKLDKNTLKDIGYTIFYQTFVFFPMLQNVFTLLLSPGRNTFSKENEDGNNKDALFQENFPKDKKRVGFTIRPVHDFPDLLDKNDKIMYNDILKMVLRAYYESLTLPNNFSIRGDNIRGEETIINYHVARSRNNLTIGTGDDFLRTEISYLDRYIIDELKYHSLLEKFMTWSYSPRID